MWRWSNGRNSRGPKFVNKKSGVLEDDEKRMSMMCVCLGHNLFGIWLETKICDF
jgi:hypothetical protein